MPLAASSRIKYQLLRTALKWTGDPSPEGMTEDEIDRMYEMTDEGDHAEELGEARSNFRYGGEDSEIAGKEYSRHYESEEKAAKLDRVRQQLEDYYERLCTDLGELGGWLSRHRTTKKLPVQGWNRDWIISHSFPGQGMHDLHLLLVIEAMTGPAVSGWLVVPMGPQIQSEKFDADDLQGALAFAATFVDPF